MGRMQVVGVACPVSRCRCPGGAAEKSPNFARVRPGAVKKGKACKITVNRLKKTTDSLALSGPFCYNVGSLFSERNLWRIFSEMPVNGGNGHVEAFLFSAGV